MVSDTIVVQYASSGLIASGLLAVFAATSIFPTRVSIGEVTRKNPLPWSPRDLGGGGLQGRSPVFGAMWFLIFASQFAFCVALFAFAAQQRQVVDDRSLFTQSACSAGALLMASVWSPLFTEEKKYTFLLSSVLLVVTAIETTVGAIASKPFFVDEGYMVFGGVSTTFFAGWCLVAAGLGVGIVTRVNNRGINAPESKADAQYSYFPLVLALLTLVLAAVVANPIFPLPLLVTLAFVHGITSDWRIWGAAIVCVVGVLLGVVMVFVYRGSEYPF